MSDQYVPIGEAADELGVSVVTLRSIMRRKSIKVYKSQLDRRKKYVSRKDIEQLKGVDDGQDYDEKPTSFRKAAAM